MSFEEKNEKKYVPIEDAAVILDISVKFLKRCLKSDIIDYEIENTNIFIDIHSVKNFLSLKETAKILSVSPRTVRRYTKNKKEHQLKSYQFKKDFGYQLSDIEEFINNSIYKAGKW